ncbi:hypothetical protein WA158_002431 [Blastocystis sp. Blastoise]
MINSLRGTSKVLKGYRLISYVTRGTNYEQFVYNRLSTNYISLLHCGGPNDKGIDIRGTINIDDKLVPLIIQCKYQKQKISVKQIREFCGTIQNEYSLEETQLVSPISMFCSATGYSLPSLEYTDSISYPLLLLHLSPNDFHSIYANKRFSDCFRNIHLVKRIEEGISIPSLLYKGYYLL